MIESTGKYDTRNFIINASEGALFIMGSSLISYSTVLPALVRRLGGNNIAVGLLSILVWFGLFIPQIFASRYALHQQWKKPGAIRLGLIQRMVLPCIVFVLLFSGVASPQTALVLFFFFIFAYSVSTGIATPIWYDMYAKLTPVGLRGRLLGIRTFTASIGAFLAAFALTWMLTVFPFPINFALIFLSTFILQYSSILLQYYLIEESPTPATALLSFPDFLSQLKMVFRTNKNLRRLIAAAGVCTLATMPLGFFTIYGLNAYNANESVVGEFTLFMIIGQGSGAIMNGYIADRWGNKAALLAAAGGMLIASTAALLAPTLFYYKFIFVFLGMNLGSELMTRQNLLLEYSPINQRSMYVGLVNSLMAPLYFVGIIGGWIAEYFGYAALFLAGIFLSVLGMSLIALLVEEPRNKKL
jgi:MFS family permease